MLAQSASFTARKAQLVRKYLTHFFCMPTMPGALHKLFKLDAEALYPQKVD